MHRLAWFCTVLRLLRAGSGSLCCFVYHIMIACMWFTFVYLVCGLLRTDVLPPLQVLAPKRSQSSQDVQHLQQRPSRPIPSLASTPEKPSGPQSDAADGQEGSSGRRDQPASNGQTQKAGGLGLLSRVASGLLGSGSRKSSSDKKVSSLCLTHSTIVARPKCQSSQAACKLRPQ